MGLSVHWYFAIKILIAATLLTIVSGCWPLFSSDAVEGRKRTIYCKTTEKIGDKVYVWQLEGLHQTCDDGSEHVDRSSACAAYALQLQTFEQAVAANVDQKDDMAVCHLEIDSRSATITRSAEDKAMITVDGENREMECKFDDHEFHDSNCYSDFASNRPIDLPDIFRAYLRYSGACVGRQVFQKDVHYCEQYFEYSEDVLLAKKSACELAGKSWSDDPSTCDTNFDCYARELPGPKIRMKSFEPFSSEERCENETFRPYVSIETCSEKARRSGGDPLSPCLNHDRSVLWP